MPRSQSVALQSKLWGISGIPPQSPNPPNNKKKLEMLSYPHKLDWCRLTNVWYCLFTESETLETCIFKTVHWQFGDSPSTDSYTRPVGSSTTKYVILPACLFVCMSVCLSQDILPLVSDLYNIRYCLGLKHDFFRLFACLSVFHKPSILFAKNLTFQSYNNFIYAKRR